jgi:oxygen-independent coproporphyrinogen-3 oxidase
LQNDKLKQLGRIHDSNAAINAITAAKNAGFTNINCDLMFGLPTQTIADALADLDRIIAQQPTHISWYQLTLEPNTLFAKYPPRLPDDDLIFKMQEQGQANLEAANYKQYEVSAYSQPDLECRHNLNYWQFGDYLGIGAGAHSKLTNFQTNEIIRLCKHKHPDTYLNHHQTFVQDQKIIALEDLPFEFMLNALRLNARVSIELFNQHCGLDSHHLETVIQLATEKGLLNYDGNYFETTALGKRFLNDLIELFLPLN